MLKIIFLAQEFSPLFELAGFACLEYFSKFMLGCEMKFKILTACNNIKRFINPLPFHNCVGVLMIDIKDVRWSETNFC